MPENYPSQGATKDRDALMARLDERTSNIQESLADLKSLIRVTNENFVMEIKSVKTDMEISLKRFDDDIKDFKKKVDDSFVKKEAFQPVQKIAYSIVGITGTGIIGALIAMVVHR